MEIKKATYSVHEVAKILGIGRNAAYEAIKAGVIRSIHIGRRIVVPCVAVERLLHAEQ